MCAENPKPNQNGIFFLIILFHFIYLFGKYKETLEMKNHVRWTLG